VTRADLTGVLRVVGEILRIEQPVFVADEAVARNESRIELDLDLDVGCDSEERTTELGDERLASLEQAVDVRIVAVQLSLPPLRSDVAARRRTASSARAATASGRGDASSHLLRVDRVRRTTERDRLAK
jgi:hypothetical protein